MTILNVGYGTTNPQELLHLVQNNATIILQDNRNNEESTTNIEFINGIGNFGENSLTNWRLSNSNSMFCIKRSLNNITSNVLTLEENGNINVSKNIILSGDIIKNNVDIIGEINDYILTTSNIISNNITSSLTYTSNILFLYSSNLDVNTSNYINNLNSTLTTQINNLDNDLISTNNNLNTLIIDTNNSSNILDNKITNLNNKIFDSSDIIKPAILPLATSTTFGAIMVDNNSILINEYGIISGQNVDLTNYATIDYANGISSGLVFKNSVRVATISNITLSGLFLIDGVLIIENDRVLVKDQSNKNENGIYLSKSGSWLRASDFDSNTAIKGSFVFVENGDLNANTSFVCSNNSSIVIDTTEILFTKFTSAGQIFADNGLIKDGNKISINPKLNGGIVFDNKQALIKLDAPSISGVLPENKGGTGKISLDNAIILSKHTTGTYVSTITAGNGINTTGLLTEEANHTLSVSTKINGGLDFESGKLALSLSHNNISGVLPVQNGGTGANSLNKLISLVTHTSGNFVSSIIVGNGITTTGADGEGAIHNLSINAKANGGLIFENSKVGLNLAATNITGTLGISNGGTGGNTAQSARLSLGVDPAGTDNSVNVTLESVPNNYLSIVGQKITSGIIPVSLGGTGSTSLNNLIILGEHTTGNFVSSITAGNGISTTGLTGEKINHTLSINTKTSGGLNFENNKLALSLSDNSITGVLSKNNGGTGHNYLNADIIPAGTSNMFIVNNTISGNIVVSGNILPSQNETFNLGSPEFKWGSLYVGANTINIGNTKISASSDGGLEMSIIKFSEKINNITSNELHSLKGVSKNIQNQIDELNLDNIANGDVNKYIINDQYNGTISVASNLNVGKYFSTLNPNGNLHVYGDITIEGDINTFNPLITQYHRHISNYNTGYIDLTNIDDVINKPSIKIQHNVGYSNILEVSCKGDDGIFTISSNGNIGINNLEPIEKLDIIGNVKISGNINNITYQELDKLSGIDYNIKDRIDTNDINHSNYILNESNILFNIFSNFNIDTSNYIFDVNDKNNIRIDNVNSALTAASNEIVVNYKLLDDASRIYIDNVNSSLNTSIQNIIDIDIPNTSNILYNKSKEFNNDNSNYIISIYNELININQNVGGDLIETSNVLYNKSKDFYIINSDRIDGLELNLNSSVTTINNNISTTSNVLFNKSKDFYNLTISEISNVNTNLTNSINTLNSIVNTNNTNITTYVNTLNTNVNSRIDLLNTDLTDYITANDAYIQNINTSANIFTFFNPSQFLYAGNNIINLNKAGYENLGGIKLGPNTTIDNNGVMSINLATYLGDIEIKGDLITSNLTILGDKTTLETNVFTTEKLEINNSGTDTAVSIVQNGVSDDILSLSNSTGEVLIVRNNGNIGLGVSIPTNKLDINGNINIVSGANNFIFTIDGEDVILNTSNDISRNLNENITTLNNYINTTSNVISERITNLDTNLIAETANSSNRFIINNVYGDDLSVIGNVDINGNINIVSGANNFIFTIDGEDVILNTSNDISRNLNENVTTLNNYINTTSNLISERITNLNTNVIAETANSSNRFIINNVYGDDLSVLGNINIVSGANNFIFTIDGEDVILNTSNDISRNLNENVTTLNNYINTTSNLISERITNLDTANITQSVEANAQNITNVSNLISERITNLNTNVIAETANSSNRFIINNVYGDDLSVLGNINIVSGANNFIFTIDGEDVILNTSNDISRNLNENVTTLNNYINTTSNLISERITNLDTTNITQSVEANAQNITNVSNVISERITNLNTNLIAETANSSNRFIINNVYGDDLSVLGNINIVSGANNFIFTIDGEDVILNTSNDISRNLNENVTTLNNYINTTSNVISERITNLDTANITQSVEANAQNITNVSNLISERITNLNTNVIAETANSSNRFIINNVYGDDLSVLGNINIVSGANNFIFTIDGEDVILNTSNDISRNLNENVTTLNNYINTTSNLISERITNLDTANITQSVEANAQNITNVSNLISERITNLNTNVIAETANSSNRFIINNVYGDDLSVLGNINIVSGANNFIFTIDGEDVILNTSNDISRNLNENVTTLNNYINTTSNLISERITNLDTANITQSVEANAQNITNVSNLISERITNLNTNVIAETANSSNRFIINNVYGDDLSVLGNINIVSGANNFIFTIDGEDVILNTSNDISRNLNENVTTLNNYINTTSNLISERITNLDTANITQSVEANAQNITNVSNLISERITNLDTNLIAETANSSNRFIINNVYGDDLSVLGNINIVSGANNFIFTIDGEDVILNTSNDISRNLNENVTTLNNYINTTSNLISERITNLDTANITQSVEANAQNITNVSNLISERITNLNTNVIAETANSSNRFIINNVYGDDLSVLGNINIVSGANNFIFTIDGEDVILNTSNDISRNLNENVTTLNNYINTTSNLISERITNLDTTNITQSVEANAQNITNVSNVISERITNLNTNVIAETANSSNRFIINNVYGDDLSINGNLNVTNNLIVSGNTTTLNTNLYNTEQLIIDNSAAGVGFELIQSNLTHDIFRISNSTNQVFLINNSGDIGLGITNPSNKIDLNGNINITGSYKINGNALQYSDLGILPISLGGTGETTAQNAAKAILPSNINTGDYLKYDGTYWVGSAIVSGEWGTSSPSTITNDIYHNDSSVISGVYYASGSLVNITGNIGTGSLGEKMGIYITNNSRTNAVGIGYNTISQIGSDVDASLSIKSKNAGLVYIGNNTSTPLSISSTSVGIGTSSHSAKLHIVETSGTLHNPNTGSVIIDHENDGGASSIIFRSKINRGSDYGFIQYQDTNEINATGELSKLIIGTRNETSDHLILDPSGNVGIGIYSPADKVHIDGNLLLSGTISTYYSDERLKTITETLNDVLPTLEKINVFKYNCNDLAESFGYNKNKVEIGLSAQQIKNYYPELVDLAPFDSIYDNETGGKISKSGENYLTLNYERLIPVLLQAIKELNINNKKLEVKCNDLEKNINQLKKYLI